MSKFFKILIKKEESNRKVVSLKEPLVLSHCNKIFLKSASIFWDYNNLNEKYFYNYDLDGTNTKVVFKNGYYNFSQIKKSFENTGNIELEEIPSLGKCNIKSDKKNEFENIGSYSWFFFQ